jgi:hypothetical protein
MPVKADGTINAAKARKWIARTLDPHRRTPAKPADGTATPKPLGVTATTAEARTRKLVHESNLLALELRQRQGELVDRKAAEAAVFARARFERDAWVGWSSRAAPALAAKFGVDLLPFLACSTRSYADINAISPTVHR